jgi:hypothetical protein
MTPRDLLEYIAQRRYKKASKQRLADIMHLVARDGLPGSVAGDFPVPIMPTRVRAIMTEVAAAHRVPLELFFVRTRIREITQARFEAMARIREEIPVASYHMIAKWFAVKDHTTVLHGIKVHRKSQEDGEKGRGKLTSALAPQSVAL